MPKRRDTINSNRKLTSIAANKVFFLKEPGGFEKPQPPLLRKINSEMFARRPQKILPKNGLTEAKKTNMFKTAW